MSELLSGAALAARLGITKQAISKAKRDGRLSPAALDARGRPLYDWAQVSRVFMVDLPQVDRVDDRGGRPPRRQKTDVAGGSTADLVAARAQAVALPWPLSNAVVGEDGISLDLFSRPDLEGCFPGVGRFFDSGQIPSCGTFPGGAPAYSFEDAVVFLRGQPN